jgi:hypothetical protein
MHYKLANSGKGVNGLIIPMIDARRMKFIALFFHIILDMKREVQAEIITENSF